MSIKIFDGKGRVLSDIKHYTGYYKQGLLEGALNVFLDKLQNPDFSKILSKLREIENLEDKDEIDEKLKKLEKEMQGITLIYYGRKAYTIAKKQNQIVINGIQSINDSTNQLNKFKNTSIYSSFKQGIDYAIDLTPYSVLSNQTSQSNTC